MRRAHAFRDQHRPDSAARYLQQAWQLAGHRQGQQSVPVIKLANELAEQHYARGNYDSTLYYYQQAARQFRVAGLDSSMGPIPTATQPAAPHWADRALLVGILANAGLACRALGSLPQALGYYERARLFQQHEVLTGLGWTQCLLGETEMVQLR